MIQNKLKIIFLDIDGVLNVIPQGHDKYGGIFHKHFEDNLKYLIENTNAKIVISSSWRGNGIEELREMWKFRNLAGEIIGVTPYMDNRNRSDEIQYWIDNNQPIENYVIIDDDNVSHMHKNNFIKTSDNIDHPDCIDIGYGLTKICTEKAIKILNNI